MGLTKKSAKSTIIKEWVAALRSGKYKQGVNKLHTKGEGHKKDEFCCLGVLCDLAVQAKVIRAPKLNKNEDNYSNEENYSYGKTSTLLPTAVKKWAGLRTTAGEFKAEVDGEDSLTGLNDWSGEGFKRIATIIESQPDGLFVK